ncbi:MAG: glycine cleavage system protein GcvH [Gammaproteobacteria bacterium]|nr:glycine cleavage system protein GcvH [Gammaproteobacteria bacterium]
MSKTPANLKYTKSHEWVELLADGTLRVGITDHAQDLLGDMVFVELPEPGRSVTAGQECAVVESVKAASDVYSPVSGEVVAVNEALGGSPDLVNKDAYGEGWMMRIKPSSLAELDSLLDANAYAELVAAEAH